MCASRRAALPFQEIYCARKKANPEQKWQEGPIQKIFFLYNKIVYLRMLCPWSKYETRLNGLNSIHCHCVIFTKQYLTRLLLFPLFVLCLAIMA